MTKKLKASGLWTGEVEFQNFRIVQMPTGSFVSAKITRMPHDNMIMIQVSDTEFCLAREVVKPGFSYPLAFDAWPWQRVLIDALLKVGAISKATHDGVVEAEKRISDIKKRKRLKSDLKKIAESLGIDLTDDQLRQIKT